MPLSSGVAPSRIQSQKYTSVFTGAELCTFTYAIAAGSFQYPGQRALLRHLLFNFIPVGAGAGIFSFIFQRAGSTYWMYYNVTNPSIAGGDNFIPISGGMQIGGTQPLRSFPINGLLIQQGDTLTVVNSSFALAGTPTELITFMELY